MECRQVPEQRCSQVPKSVSRPIFPSIPVPKIEIDYNDAQCSIGCECVDFASCQGSKFEELFSKSDKKQKFEGQFCNIMPPRVCCCSRDGTGKSFSEVLILASTNLQYHKICSLNYQLSTWNSKHSQNMSCTQIVFCLFLFWHSEQFAGVEHVQSVTMMVSLQSCR